MRALYAHALLALVATVIAFGARRQEEVPGGEGALLSDCVLASARYEREGRAVRVERDGAETAVEVRTPEGVARFVGGEEAAALLDELGGLRAERSILEDGSERGFGAGTLELTCDDGASTTLDIGDVLPGSRDRFARDGAGVHQLDARVVRAFEGAEVLLMRRRLHDFDERDLASVTLAGAGVSTTLERTEDGWRDPARPEHPGAARLMGAHRNLRAEAGAEPPDAEPLVTLTYRDDEGTELGSLRFVQLGRGPGATHLAHTEAIGWVRLPTSIATAFTHAVDSIRTQ